MSRSLQAAVMSGFVLLCWSPVILGLVWVGALLTFVPIGRVLSEVSISDVVGGVAFVGTLFGPLLLAGFVFLEIAVKLVRPRP